MTPYSKHEMVACDRCGKTIECKANSSIRCQCNSVLLNINELQYVSEHFDGCLCAGCLTDLKKAYSALYNLL